MIQKEASGKSADDGPFGRRVSLRAHFGSRGRAEQAANAVGHHARMVYVSVNANVSRATALRPARPGHSRNYFSVILGQPHWLAFGAGLAIGLAALQLIFPGLLAATQVGPAPAGDLAKAVIALIAGAVAFGWLKSALGYLWRRLPRPPGYELQAEVLGPTLSAAEQALRETGAVVVWVLSDESLPVIEPAD